MAATLPVTALKGIVPKPRKPVSIDAMNAAWGTLAGTRAGGAVAHTPEQLACRRIDAQLAAWCTAPRARHLHVVFAA
ncbi:MAG: hypothetical protein ACREPJ_06785 [Rhodanobacteraceae bacterium]